MSEQLDTAAAAARDEEIEKDFADGVEQQGGDEGEEGEDAARAARGEEHRHQHPHRSRMARC